MAGVERPVRSPAWVRDLAQTHALQASPLGRAAVDLLARNGRAVSRRIAVLERYCETLCAAAPTFTHPERLHAVFWIDRLTVALAAARQYTRARAWCARVARLPARARTRAAPSLLRAIAARRRRGARAVWAPPAAAPRRP